MRTARLAALALALALTPAAAAVAETPPLPPVDPPPVLDPEPDVLSLLPTHGVDLPSIAIPVEVPGPAGGPEGAPLDAAVTVDAETVRRSQPTRWCGEPRGSDDTEHALANGDAHVHAIYVVPADAPDRFGSLASDLQADAFQASSLIERLYGRAIRYDMGTSCGGQYLDISVVRMSQTTAQLQALVATPNATYAAVQRELERAGFAQLEAGEPASTFGGRQNYLVWLDGPAPVGCGQAGFHGDSRRDPANENNVGGKVALVFRSGSGFCNSNAARHEIGHNLGAVQRGAPHSDGGGHCNDTPGDTMCLTDRPVDGDTFQALYFDARGDDYWGDLPWWTVDLSRFICPEVACNVPGGLLARQAAPTGGGAGYAPALRATVKASRDGRRWRFRVRVRGTGRARVTVTCKRAGRRRRVLSRVVKLPAIVRGNARCDGRPRASARRVAG